MAWIKLSISCPQEYLDNLKDLLDSFDAKSISLTPASPEQVFDDLSGNEKYWKITVLSALLDPEIDLDILLACIRNRIGTENITDYHIDLLQDEDWEGAIKAEFKPVIIKNKLCVYPSWSETPTDILYTIQLDPGLAFGTGAHETTSLCLQWLVDNPVRNMRVVDYGCGSGILAIAAAKLGALEVTCIDLDPQALGATRDNAEKNDVQGHIRILPEAKPEKNSADILIANILLEPLLQLSRNFASYLTENGKIVLSGLLAHQVDTCLDCYSDWFDMSEPVYENEWVLLTGVKKRIEL